MIVVLIKKIKNKNTTRPESFDGFSLLHYRLLFEFFRIKHRQMWVVASSVCVDRVCLALVLNMTKTGGVLALFLFIDFVSEV